MVSVTRSQLLAFRARRQYLSPEARGRTPEDVLAILRALQPFPPIAGSMPGSAPHPRSRIVGYDDAWSERWRAAGRLIKGRFMNGNIAYVTKADLVLYAAAFRRPLRDPLSRPERRIRGLLEQYGPMPKSTLREMVAIERGRFDRALTSLNRAFEVMEIQRQVDWDSPWDLSRNAYPDADPAAWEQIDAQAEVLRRFTRAFGPATVTQMASWSGWNLRTIDRLLDHLLAHHIVRIEIEGEEEPTYLASEDSEELIDAPPVSRFVVVLPTNDPFVMPQWSLLRTRYRPYPLPYCYCVVVVDGKMVGAAWGHYKRRFIHVEELSLEPTIVRDPHRADEVLAQLESYLGAGQAPIHIYGINQDADAPWIADILVRNGFLRQAGYYVKETARIET